MPITPSLNSAMNANSTSTVRRDSGTVDVCAEQGAKREQL